MNRFWSLHHNMAPPQEMMAPDPGQVLGLPLPPHGHLGLPGHLPPPGAEASCVRNPVAPVQHASHARPQAGEGDLDPQLSLYP